jgi:tryptophanyl-tRNA synthetase
MKKVLFSGVQPTGHSLMLGNYLGAIKQWVALQDQYSCLYCVVDLHAITVKQDPAALRTRSMENLALYIAAGLDPKKNLLFLQSHVPQHAELAWILTCHTYMGELSRMTQFKDKSAKGQNVGTGLYTYPVLMAADILLYQTALVPVGHDQKQHLELTRDLAIRMNNTYGKVFEVPEVFIPQAGARIMSLMDPSAKMSKSDTDANATVYLTDSEDVIAKKFKRAVTDSVGVVQYNEEQLGVRNLINIQSAILGETPEQVVARYQGKQYGALKTETAEIVINALRPIQTEYKRLLNDRTELEAISKKAAQDARQLAEKTLIKVKDAMGFA